MFRPVAKRQYNRGLVVRNNEIKITVTVEIASTARVNGDPPIANPRRCKQRAVSIADKNRYVRLRRIGYHHILIASDFTSPIATATGSFPLQMDALAGPGFDHPD